MLHCLLPTSWVPPLTPPNAKMLEGERNSTSRPMPLIRAFIMWRELVIVQMFRVSPHHVLSRTGPRSDL